MKCDLRLCLRVGFWRGRKGKAYEEVNPCLRVLKKQEKGFGGLEGLNLSNFKVPQIGGVTPRFPNIKISLKR